MTQDQPINRELFILAACYFIQAVASLSVVGLLVPMEQGLGVSKSEIAYLVSAFSITYAIASPTMQIFVGDWDRRWLIILGLVAIALGTALTGLAQRYDVAVLGRMIMAVGAGVSSPMASATGAALVAPENRGMALGKVFAGMTFATVIGVPFAAWGGEVLGWRQTLLAIAVTAAVIAMAVWIFVPTTQPGQKSRFADVWMALTNRVIAPAIAVTGFQMAAQFATYSVIAAYLMERMAMPPGWLPIVLMIFGIGGILGNVVATALIGRMGPNRLILASLASTGLVFLGLHFAPPLPWLVFVLMSAWAVCALALFAPQQTRVVALRPEMANLLLALNGTAVYGGMAVGAAISGALYAASGTDWLALASTLLIGCALLSFWVSTRDGEGR